MRKKALTGIEQILLLVLIILTLFAVFFMFYKGDIITKIKNLPGYGYTPQGDEVISGSEEVVQSESCLYKVGELRAIKNTKQAAIYFCQDLSKVGEGCEGYAYSRLKVDTEDVKIEKISGWADPIVGSFTNKEIKISDSFYDSLDNYNLLKETQMWLKNPLLSYSNLEGSKAVGNDLCRDEVFLTSKLCPVKIGEVRDEGIFVCEKEGENIDCKKLIQTEQYLSNSNLIKNEVKQIKRFGKDPSEGLIVNHKISMYDSSSSLNGATVLFNGDICIDELVISQ